MSSASHVAQATLDSFQELVAETREFMPLTLRATFASGKVVEAAVPRAPIAAVEASRRAPDVIEAAGVAEVRACDARALSCLRKRLV